MDQEKESYQFAHYLLSTAATPGGQLLQQKQQPLAKCKQYHIVIYHNNWMRNT